MSINKDSQKAPNLRFKGFTDDWEQRKLRSISKIVTGGTPKTTIKKYWAPEEIPWMSSGEINKKRLKDTDAKISKIGFNNSSAKWVKTQSILIALAGQGKTRGTVAINYIPLTTNQSIAAIEPNEEINAEYLYQNLNNRYDELRLKSSGDGTRGGLNKKIISDLMIPIPELKEQLQIGLLLKTVDKDIDLHQRKLDQLNQLKEALLQQMFPGKGETVPKLRFAGFKGDWEERKLGDIFLYKQGLQVPVENQFTEQGDNRHRFIRIVDLTTTNEKPRYIEYSGHNTVSSTDLFMIRYGQPGVIGYGYEGVIANNLFKLIPKIEINNLFFKYILSFMYLKINSLSSSTTMPAISFKSLDILDVKHPDIKEQEKNGVFFKGLDSIITLHQRKLEQLQDMKQALLQNMFI